MEIKYKTKYNSNFMSQIFAAILISLFTFGLGALYSFSATETISKWILVGFIISSGIFLLISQFLPLTRSINIKDKLIIFNPVFSTKYSVPIEKIKKVTFGKLDTQFAYAQFNIEGKLINRTFRFYKGANVNHSILKHWVRNNNITCVTKENI